MTQRQLYRKVRSLAWRRNMADGLEELESDIRSYMRDEGRARLVVAGYSLRLVEESLQVEALPEVDKNQLRFAFPEKGKSVQANLKKNYFGHEVKVRLVRETRPVADWRVNTPGDAYKLLRDELRTLDREVFIVVSLNTKNKVLGLNVVSVGSLESSLTHPREVFKSAILLNASRVLLAHNHPSGDPTPSSNDIKVTETLINAGKLMGIEVVDHVVVGDTFYSFMENCVSSGKKKGVRNGILS